METSYPLNLKLFNLINASQNANHVVVLMAKALAVFSPWLVIAILVWLWIFKTAEIRRSLMIAGVALGIGLAVNFTLAFLFYASRPFELGIGQSLLTHSLETSFPSDHATFLWSLGFGLIITRPLRWLGVGISCLGFAVAWARVYLGVHFPLDMLASLLIASCSVVVAKLLAGKLNGIFFQPVERINGMLLSAFLPRKN